MEEKYTRGKKKKKKFLWVGPQYKNINFFLKVDVNKHINFKELQNVFLKLYPFSILDAKSHELFVYIFLFVLTVVQKDA